MSFSWTHIKSRKHGGAFGNDGNGSNSGHVRVLQWNAITLDWAQMGNDIDGEAAGDTSGYSVSLSSDGKTVAIGSRTTNQGNGWYSGHTRVFGLNASTQAWIQIGDDIDAEAAGDTSGTAVSLSSDGKTVAIGARYNDGNGTDSGHTRVFQWNAGEAYTPRGWVQMGVDIDGEAPDDRSGQSVSLSSDGKTVAIGAFGNDGNGSDSGHTRVFQWNAGNASTPAGAWVQMGIDIDGEFAGDYSGHSVSLSSDGKTVAIGAFSNGARGNDGNGPDNGHTRVFQWNVGAESTPAGAWVQMGVDIDGEAARDYSGHSVSLSSDGKTVAIGAFGNDGNGTDSGQTRVFQWNAGDASTPEGWVQMGVDIDGEAAGDQSGQSVSLSSDGKTVAIGAWSNDGNGTDSGQTRVFQWNAGDASTPAGAWVQMGVDIDGEAVDDYSGASVSLSSDGKTVAIGAHGNDENGSFSGQTRVFQWNAGEQASTLGAWVQMGIDIDGEAADDQSSRSVSLSLDGKTVAIGARNNDGNDFDSGHVRVYSVSQTPVSNQERFLMQSESQT
jgi:hypothetical protein